MSGDSERDKSADGTTESVGAIAAPAPVKKQVLRGPWPEFKPTDGPALKRPDWIRARMPGGPNYRRINNLIDGMQLHTVCKSANCPNVGECWELGTATFMINGDICTRSCTFCNIVTGKPLPLDPDEPRRVAEAAATMNLEHIVVTAVNRDERPDGGATQFADTIYALREKLPNATIEVLIPDFKGALEACEIVFKAKPDVLNHNIETVPRLYKEVRPQAVYERSLEVLKMAADAGLVSKSGLMLGLGEEEDEVLQVIRDLRAHEVMLVTIGQYLRPTPKHHPIMKYATPDEFARYKAFGMELGFSQVDSGPLVRSSYHAKSSFTRAKAAGR